MKNKGFTLIELMIVIAIVGIIASIGLGAYEKYSCEKDGKIWHSTHSGGHCASQ